MGRKKFTPEEQELQKRYPHDFVAGSMMTADDPASPFPGKRSIEFRCVCGKVRRLCTQDLFHVKHCAECAKDAKANRKAKKSQAKK